MIDRPVTHGDVRLEKISSFYNEHRLILYESGQDRLDYCIERLSSLDLVAGGGNGQDFATFWNQLRQSKKFITDRLVVPCTA